MKNWNETTRKIECEEAPCGETIRHVNSAKESAADRKSMLAYLNANCQREAQIIEATEQAGYEARADVMLRLLHLLKRTRRPDDRATIGCAIQFIEPDEALKIRVDAREAAKAKASP